MIRAASVLKPDDTRLSALLRQLAELTNQKGRRDRTNPYDVLAPQLESLHVDYVNGTATALTAIAKNLVGLPGRKNLVWISSAFPMGIQLPKARTMLFFTDETQKATRMLNDANVAVYPIDPRGLSSGVDVGGGAAASPPDPMVPAASDGIVTMNTVAQATGGRAFYNDNSVSAAIQDVMEDGEVMYTLGFYPEATSLDGTFHDLKVKVARSGVDVRYRKGYYASQNVVVSEKQLRGSMQEMLESPFDATEIGIVASGERDPATPGKYKLTAKVNISDLHMERGSDAMWTGSIAVAFRVDSDPSPKSQVVVVPLRLSDEQYKAALKDGLMVPAGMDLSAMPVRVRAMIQDQKTGAAGSVWIPVPAK